MSFEPLVEPDSDFLLDHFDCPFHKGRLDSPTGAHSVRNPVCGDEVRLEILAGPNGSVEQAYFEGRGCVISQAAASILCEHIEGRTAEELRRLTSRDMLELLRVPLSPFRQQCGLLAFRALTAILQQQAPARRSGAA